MANISEEEYIKRMQLPEIGVLYNENIEKPYEHSKQDIYDDSTRNYHFYPADSCELEDCVSEISGKFHEVKTHIKKICKSESSLYAEVSSRIELDKVQYRKDKIYFWLGSNGKLNGASNIIYFIRAVKNGVLYELNFMRFFFSKDKKINCIVKSIQFDRVVDDNPSISKKYANANGLFYPTSYRGQSIDTLNKVLDRGKDHTIYYNPKVQFDAEPEEIVDAFIEFINICDKKDKEQ